MTCPAQYRILLHELLSNGTGFKALSDWMVVNSSQHQLLVAVWCEELRKAKPTHIEIFFRLLNLVVRHKDGKPYQLYFRTIIEDVFSKAIKGLSAKDEELLLKLQEMVQLWHSSEIFGPALGDKLQRCLTSRRKLLKLKELFPEVQEPELFTVLTRCKGNLDSAISCITQQKPPRNDLDSTLRMLEMSSTCSWADVEDDVETSASPNSQKSSTTSSVREAKHSKQSQRKTVAANEQDIDLSSLGDTQLRYVQHLEKRVKDLEETISKQNADLERLSRNYVKIEEFVKELRVECGKLVQKKLNVETTRGNFTLPIAGNRDSDSTPRSCRSRNSADTPRLNPGAAPFVPYSVSSFSSCTGSVSSESPEVTEVC